MYDTIVIGNDLSSLIAALASTRGGRKTILLCDGNIPDYISESGYTFNIDPFPWTLSPQLLSKIDVSLMDPARIYPLDPPLQVILPEHRIDLFSEIDPLLKELKREFSIETKDLGEFYESVIKNNRFIEKFIYEKPYMSIGTLREYCSFIFHIPFLMWSKKNLLKKLEDIQEIPSLKQVFDSEILLLSNFRTDSVKPLSLAYTFSLLLDKFHYHIGGKHHLVNELREKFKARGGTIIKWCSILRLNINEEIRADVMMDSETFTIEGRNVVISTKWEKLKPILLKDNRFSRFVKKFTSVQGSVYPFTIHMGLNDRGIPEKMAEYVVVISDEKKPLTGGNLIFLEMSARGDTDRAPSGKRAISASVFLEESPLRLNDENLRKISIGMLKNIEKPLPFLGDNLDFINIDSSIDTSRKYQEVLNQKYTTKKNPFLGISLLPSIQGKTFMEGKKGEGTYTIPFEKIKSILFTIKNAELKGYIQLKDNTVTELILNKDYKAYGRTKYGTFQIKLVDLKKMTLGDNKTKIKGN